MGSILLSLQMYLSDFEKRAQDQDQKLKPGVSRILINHEILVPWKFHILLKNKRTITPIFSHLVKLGIVCFDHIGSLKVIISQVVKVKTKNKHLLSNHINCILDATIRNNREDRGINKLAEP